MLDVDEPFFHDRSIPFFSPRHSTHTSIHWNFAQTEDFREYLVGLDVISEPSLIIVHIMGITLPIMNQAVTVERKDLQPWFDELGKKLQDELENIS